MLLDVNCACAVYRYERELCALETDGTSDSQLRCGNIETHRDSTSFVVEPALINSIPEW